MSVKKMKYFFLFKLDIIQFLYIFFTIDGKNYSFIKTILF